MAFTLSVSRPSFHTVAAVGEIGPVAALLQRLAVRVRADGPAAHRPLLLNLVIAIGGRAELGEVLEALGSADKSVVGRALDRLLGDPSLHTLLSAIAEQEGVIAPRLPTPAPPPATGAFVASPLWRPKVPEVDIRRAVLGVAAVPDNPLVNPYEEVLRLFFPRDTEEGAFLTELVERQTWREESREGGFPRDAGEFFSLLRIVTGNAMEPIILRQANLETVRRMKTTPPPPAAIVARGLATPPPMPRLSGETVGHYELVLRLIDRLEKRGIEVVQDPTLRAVMKRLTREDTPATRSSLFLGQGARQLLVNRVREAIEAFVGGTGTRVAVHAYRSHGFRRMTARPDSFQTYLGRHFTAAERAALNRFGSRPANRRERFYSETARLLATKRSVLRLLGLDAEGPWLDLEIVDPPRLTGPGRWRRFQGATSWSAGPGSAISASGWPSSNRPRVPAGSEGSTSH